MADGQDEIFQEKINKVQMFVFDNTGVPVYEGMLSATEVRQQRTMLPPLSEGDYRIAFIGNPHSTSVKGLDSKDYSKIFFGAHSFWEGKTVSGNDSLYFSAIDYAIAPFSSEKKITRKTAEFSSSHYDIIVEVIGAGPDVLSGEPFIVLDGVSPYADFANTATSQSQTQYVLNASYAGGSKIVARCNILRHQDHSKVWLHVMDKTGVPMASINFADFLDANRDHIDCSKHEVVIPFKVEFKSAEVHIGLPDWWVVDIHPGWN